MRIAFAGTPEFAVPTLRALMQSPHQLVGVLTQPDRPRGRGRHLSPSPVKAALHASIPVVQPATLKSADDRAPLLAWSPDVLVVVAYGLLLPKAVLEIPRLGCVNVHASLLPRWRGAAPIERALLAGDETTGITITLMDEGLDTGPVLLQRPLAIDPQDTGASLRTRLAMEGASLLLEALQGLGSGALHPRPQPSAGATYARKLDKREAPIDWSRPAAEIERQIRALQPWPVAETECRDPQTGVPDRLLVHASRLAPDDNAAAREQPGCIVATDGRHGAGYIRVQCGEGRLDLLLLQRPGGQPQPASLFTRGPRALARSMVLGGMT
ncbi:MAG TPA: methionyl-tRNA formyltransferase [Steroidobacteraceae bacterium]|nr:methionyl-tRNA formyltransferase [Steroidobacteraceae bacterium]